MIGIKLVFLLQSICLCLSLAPNPTSYTVPIPKSHHEAPNPLGSIWITRKYRSLSRRVIQTIFDSIDANHNNQISFDEAYVGFLLLYIHLNRRAPIHPPSREDALRLFLTADRDGSNYLSVEQYTELLHMMLQRAFLRLTTHKTATFVGAPLLTEVIVRRLAERRDELKRWMEWIVPTRYREEWVPVLASMAFQRTFWTTILVVTLGNLCLGVVNLFLRVTLPSVKSSDRRWRAYKDGSG